MVDMIVERITAGKMTGGEESEDKLEEGLGATDSEAGVEGLREK